MTRNELLKKWCAAEHGKVQALDWPQAKEAYAKLRKIILRENGVDLDDIIKDKVTATIYHGANVSAAYLWRATESETITVNGKPAKRAARKGR